MQFGWLGFLVFSSQGIMRKEIIKFGVSKCLSFSQCENLF